MKKTIHYYIIVSLIIIFGWTGLSLYWAFAPYTVVTFAGSATEVINKVLHPGDKITLKANAVQNIKGVRCVVIRTLEDGLVYTYTPMVFVTKGGTQTGTSSVVNVPIFAPPGIYRLHNIFTCRVNPVRTVVFERYSENFNVIKP